jgi:hypothetical protein
VGVDRLDGFDDPVEVRLDNLPTGFSAPPTFIPAGENSTTFALYAEPGAAVAADAKPLVLRAEAMVAGQAVRQTVVGEKLRAIDPGDIVTSTVESEVTVRPGGEASVTVKVDRRNGFKGRIPIEVRGLPHGVEVLDVGLNGILITEQESARTFVLRALPWVRPMVHPFVVVARREATGAEAAARSILLRVSERAGSAGGPP